MEMISAEFWKGKKVFLTGCTGFKGSWLSLWLREMGSEIMGYALPPPTQPSLFGQTKLDELIHWREGDIRDRQTLSESMVKFQPEIVIHLAAQPLVRDSYIDPVGTYETNVMGTVNLFEAVRACKTVRAVVNVTTDKCYENREWEWGYREDEAMGGYDPYSSSKGCSELVTSAYQRSYFSESNSTFIASARAGNVIGGGDYAKDRLVPDIIRALVSGQKVIIRNPQSIRPWQHVLEPLSGYLLLAQKLYLQGKSFEGGWNFGPFDNDAKPVEWIVKNLSSKFPNSSGYELSSGNHPHEAKYLKLDISKARSRLGWSPRWNLEETLNRIVEFENFGQNKADIIIKQIKDYLGVSIGA